VAGGRARDRGHHRGGLQRAGHCPSGHGDLVRRPGPREHANPTVAWHQPQHAIAVRTNADVAEFSSVANVQLIRTQTVTSPSSVAWKEIRVVGEPMP